ncbi:immunity 53 family protein [Streptomyces sp. NPDC059378]|uniref:immunity 53 family protein n=1 Tax=Streptomyces sp. NPDC059378 TaxID=3346815 RepID=UPI003692843D
MSDSDSVLGWLQGWYAEQCDGDWEHEWGVKIATLDNPGWTITIDLEDTSLEEREYPKQTIRRGPNDWIFARVVDHQFDGACGPGNLTELLTMFRSWVEER